MSNERELTVKANENTLVMLIDYEKQSVELFNGSGKPLHIEGEINKSDGFLKIDIRVDIRE